MIVLDRADNTIHTAVRDLEAALERGFPAVWNLVLARSSGSRAGRPARHSHKRVGHEPPALLESVVGLEFGKTALD
ncbi:hypothetical protein C491_17444 [Natronococcus amylolyticus DSM 10524]|uniref:Uncharacterized protein n=1 Tax=Natronococcus amylolyticus DSM 10524 TaxID=1227497 RepID=L9WZX7_9EURY|nr:hypothetical protein C491_17444 [Natronococcus amylolyticus DSM 10524]